MLRIRIMGPGEERDALLERLVEARQSVRGGAELTKRERRELKDMHSFPLGLFLELAAKGFSLTWLLAGEGAPLALQRVVDIEQSVRAMGVELDELSTSVARHRHAAQMTLDELILMKSEANGALEQAQRQIVLLRSRLADAEAELQAANFQL